MPMLNIKFDGKKEAEKVADFLEETERVLGKSLIIFQCDGKSEESTYVRLKREMGERLGVIVHVVFVASVDDLKSMIVDANEDETVDGILVQLPILDDRSSILDRREMEKMLGLIDPKKDVDGLNPESSFVPAVVSATERVMDIFKVEEDQQVALVGAKGMVGSRLGERLATLGIKFTGFDKGDDLQKLKNFDVVITATGVADLIKPEMVVDGFVGIDLGFPKAEFSIESAEKALLVTPVPNGVGPLTVVALYENLALV